MEVIYLILLFLAPGLLVRGIQKTERITDHEKVKSGTIYEQLFKIVVYSVIISSLSILAVWVIHLPYDRTFPKTISKFVQCLDDMRMLVSYIVIMGIVSLIIEKVDYHIIQPQWFRWHNKKMDVEHGVKKANYTNPTVWEDIFLNAEKNEKPLIASLYKDGAYITSGIIQSWNSGKDDPNEFEIVRTKEIEKIMQQDLTRNKEEKWLDYIDYEFFDCNSGVLIKFYNTDRALEHWDDL